MAFVVRDRSVCAGCGLVLAKGQELATFPAFVANRRDPLYRFSDAAFHLACFERDPLHQQAQQRLELIQRHSWPSGYPRCAACGGEIVQPDEYFGTSFLTDDPQSQAFEFNFVHLHRSHFGAWKRAPEFRAALNTFLSSSEYDGPPLEFDPDPRWGAP